MPHFVTPEDSDYFVGYCACNQLPCLSCVAAQQRFDAAEKLRGELCRIYYAHHKQWPQSAFIDAILSATYPRTEEQP